MILHQIDTPGHNIGQRPTQKHSSLAQGHAEKQHGRTSTSKGASNMLQESRLAPFLVRAYSRTLQERGSLTDSMM